MNATSIEIGNNEGIAITKDGKVIGFVKVKRQREDAVELVAYPVNLKVENWSDDKTWHSFATTMTLDVEQNEYLNVDTFIKNLEF